MPISKALENSARDFSRKYACHFDFATFESSVEEFTFLRPNGGWIDVYKMMFDRMYKNMLEKAVVGAVEALDGEAMLDDFEYTLIRPYVKESEGEIKHKPYVGMDRITRLEYLDRLTKQAPSTPVGLCAEKYKNGELSIRQMTSALAHTEDEQEHYVEIASYVQALEQANEGRSLLWRTLHPIKDLTEKREAARMKAVLVDKVEGGEAFYYDIVAAANRVFDGYKTVNANLAQSMAHAREEVNRLQKINDAIRETRLSDALGKEPERPLRALN